MQPDEFREHLIAHAENGNDVAERCLNIYREAINEGRSPKEAQALVQADIQQALEAINKVSEQVFCVIRDTAESAMVAFQGLYTVLNDASLKETGMTIEELVEEEKGG